ncbi:hypothetical protein CGRA01v4_00559 [Colletotrichum graminicola]|nr:hypothetical protein CGRA01v4_00559 [Colletotrichum graminicola]
MADTEQNHAFALFGQMDLALRLASPSFRVEPRQILYIIWDGLWAKKEWEGGGGPYELSIELVAFSPQRSNDAASTPADLQESKELLHRPYRTHPLTHIPARPLAGT